MSKQVKNRKDENDFYRTGVLIWSLLGKTVADGDFSTRTWVRSGRVCGHGLSREFSCRTQCGADECLEGREGERRFTSCLRTPTEPVEGTWSVTPLDGRTEEGW